MILLFAGVLATLLVFTSGKDEPRWEGQSLAHWILEYNRGLAGQTTKEEMARAVVAIQALGTNQLPILIERIGYEQPTWRVSMARLFRVSLGDSLGRVILNDKQLNLSRAATLAIPILGSNALPAVPELERIIGGTKNDNCRKKATYALQGILNAASPNQE